MNPVERRDHRALVHWAKKVIRHSGSQVALDLLLDSGYEEQYAHKIIAEASAEVVTATPEDRSNSPPIISRATPTATMPIVELAYR